MIRHGTKADPLVKNPTLRIFSPGTTTVLNLNVDGVNFNPHAKKGSIRATKEDGNLGGERQNRKRT